MSKRDDKLLLDDILEAGNKIIRFMQGVNFETFSQNDEKIDAIFRNFEVMGEAARNVSQSFKNENPQIPWREVTSYRNRLIHEYFSIDLVIVWDVIQTELSPLLEEVKKALNRV